jgi:hypothetical protein
MTQKNELPLFKGDKKVKKKRRRYSLLLKGLQEREHGFRFGSYIIKALLLHAPAQAAFRETTNCTVTHVPLSKHARGFSPCPNTTSLSPRYSRTH